jgi:predicted metal-binding membrane protein
MCLPSDIDSSKTPTARLDERPPTRLESALRGAGVHTVLLLVLVPLVSWMWIVVMARDMHGSMKGASAWMMTARWDAPHVLLLWAMWAVMMAGMMLPSASPVLLLYGAVTRRSTQAKPGRVYALAAGYLTIWSVFSLGATGLQRVLAGFLLVSPMMKVTSPTAGATLLVIAGAYQLTPIKLACLQTCRSPLGFLMSHWRVGLPGAFRMGLEHGAYCVGCCWAMMLLLFAGGVMNLTVIAALTAFVAFEKLLPFGVHGARMSGVFLMAAGLWMLVR